MTICIGVDQACSKVRVAWMWPPTASQNLSGVFHHYVGYGIIVQSQLFNLY